MEALKVKTFHIIEILSALTGWALRYDKEGYPDRECLNEVRDFMIGEDSYIADIGDDSEKEKAYINALLLKDYPELEKINLKSLEAIEQDPKIDSRKKLRESLNRWVQEQIKLTGREYYEITEISPSVPRSAQPTTKELMGELMGEFRRRAGASAIDLFESGGFEQLTEMMTKGKAARERKKREKAAAGDGVIDESKGRSM